MAKTRVVDLLLAPEIGGEGLVADDRVLLVADELEGPGADRILVDHLGRAGLQHRIHVFRGMDGGEVHGQIGDEGRVRLLQRDLDRVVVDLVDRLQQVGHAHVVEIVIGAAGDLGIGIGGLPHAVEGGDHVIRIEIARRLERLVAVEFDVLAQVENVGEPVVRHFPFLGQRRDDRGRPRLELDQPVEDRIGGVEAGAGGVDLRIEVLRASLGAVDKGLGVCRVSSAEGHRDSERDGPQKMTFHRKTSRMTYRLVRAPRVTGHHWRDGRPAVPELSMGVDV